MIDWLIDWLIDWTLGHGGTWRGWWGCRSNRWEPSSDQTNTEIGHFTGVQTIENLQGYRYRTIYISTDREEFTDKRKCIRVQIKDI